MPNDQWARNNGFQPSGSTDGTWWIGDRGSNRSDIPSNRKPVNLPSWAPQTVVDFYTINGYLDHKHAQLFVEVPASSEGASDGFQYTYKDA